MPWTEFVGTVGSFLMFSTFWMKTMIPLRVAGMAANCLMITYAALMGLYPILALQSLMLPVNVYRLLQMRKLILHVKETAAGEFRADALLPFMHKESHADRDVLFRAGDESDKLYLIRGGAVRLEEIGQTLTSGVMFGEIGLVAPGNRRTATAVCVGKTKLLSISRDEVLQLFFQNPEFGFFLIQLVTQRLLVNLEAARPAAAQP